MQGNSRGFENVNALFQSGEILAKSLNKIQVEDSIIDYKPFLKEADLLASKNGCSISSTTLLMAGYKIPTYAFNGMNSGLLIDSSKSFIVDVSQKDANTEREGKLAKRRARLDGKELDYSLEALREDIKVNSSTEMNEVSADINMDAVVGIFVKAQADSEAKIGAILAVKMFEAVHGKKLPLVEYDQRDGSIREIEISTDLVKRLAKDMNIVMKKSPQHVCEYTKYLGLEYVNQFLMRESEPVPFSNVVTNSRAITLGELIVKLKGEGFVFDEAVVAKNIAASHQDFNGDTYDANTILNKQITFPRSRLIDGLVFESLEEESGRCFNADEKERFECIMSEIKMQNINIDKKMPEELAQEKDMQRLSSRGLCYAM